MPAAFSDFGFYEPPQDEELTSSNPSKGEIRTIRRNPDREADYSIPRYEFLQYQKQLGPEYNRHRDESDQDYWSNKYLAVLPKELHGVNINQFNSYFLKLLENAKGDWGKIDPNLVDACIERPLDSKTAMDIKKDLGFMIAMQTNLSEAQIVILGHKFKGYPELYEEIFNRQFRRERVTTISPTSREGVRVRTKEDQNINRIIFELTPAKYRGIFRKTV